MKLKNSQIALLLLASVSLILQNCASSKPSKLELQQRNMKIVSNAQKITDSDAAVACFDMLTSCEQNLSDTTAAYQKLKYEVPALEKKARNKGIGLGVIVTVVTWLLLRI